MKLFKKDCINLISLLTLKYNIYDVEALLWIYLNMYFYKHSFNTHNYSKEKFIRLMEKNADFGSYYIKYHNINEEEYSNLHETILKKYIDESSNNTMIRDMEEIYEGVMSKNLREKTGSYYTPHAIVKYMTVKSITTYLDKAMMHHNIKLQNYLENKLQVLPIDYILSLLEILENIKIIDIACGGGVFLREAIHFVFNLEMKLNALIGRELCRNTLIEKILKRNIYGIDIQSTTASICKLLIYMEIQMVYGHNIENNILNIIEGNALTLDINEEFDKDFDIVIGNPPYIGEKGNKALFNEIKTYDFGSRYYESKMDYFYFFIYRAYEILKPSGLLSFITTNYFVTADGGKNLRSFLHKNYVFRTIVNFNTFNIFTAAKGQHNMIFIATKDVDKEAMTTLINIKEENIDVEELYNILMTEESTTEIESSQIPQHSLYNQQQHILIQSHHRQLKLLNKIQNASNVMLQDICYVNQGIVSGADRLSQTWAEKLQMQEDKGKGIFVLKEEEVKGLGFDNEIEGKYLKNFYKNSHIKRYNALKKQEFYILYINDENLQAIDEVPLIYNHLIKYKELLEERREVKNGVRKWYALQWPRKESIFENKKIVVPQRALENTFAYIEEPWYASADVYYITSQNPEILLLYLLGILNSSLMYFWLFYRGKRKGDYLELYATPLKTIPICYTKNKRQIKALENLVKLRMENDQRKEVTEEIQKQIDELVFNLYGLKDSEKQEIISFVNERKK